MARFFRTHAVLLTLAAIKVAIHFVINSYDNLFRDEFYYIACGRHLDWGYVDHPPLVGLAAWGALSVLGDSVFAIRLLSSLAGGALVFLTGYLAGELGGNRYAQAVAAMCALISPVYLAITGFFSMNVFDLVIWVVVMLIVVKVIQRPSPSRWIWLGIWLGIGLQNKLSVLFLGFGLFAGFLLTQPKRWLMDRWAWIAAGIAFAIFTPFIVWQMAVGYPTLEFMAHVTKFKNMPMSPVEFIKEVSLENHPLLFPVWTAGLAWLFFSKKGAPFRLFGWMFFAVVFVLILNNGKPYYLASAFSILFAAGAVAMGDAIERFRLSWLKPVWMGVLAVGGCLILPFALLVFDAETTQWYLQSIGLQPAQLERGHASVLPQHLADRYGWEEMVQQIEAVYLALSEHDRNDCVLIASNYGQAGAVEYFAGRYTVPPAISTHNSYYHWGYGNWDGRSALALLDKDELEAWFEEVIEVAMIRRPFSMPYEDNRPVYLCRKLKVPVDVWWEKSKKFI